MAAASLWQLPRHLLSLQEAQKNAEVLQCPFLEDQLQKKTGNLCLFLFCFGNSVSIWNFYEFLGFSRACI